MYRLSELMRSLNAVAFSQAEVTLQLPPAQADFTHFQLPTIPEEDEEPENINASFVEPWPS